MKSNKVHIPGFTEIRGIAAMVVLISHIDQFSGILGIPSIKISERNIADHAVTVFFVLSGFLITHLLIEEKNKIKDINIKKFYIRRILRIWPAYYTTIVISLILLSTPLFKFPEFGITIGISGFVAMVPNLIYVLGYTFLGTSPLWSIGVEEQFYLVWPWLVKKSRRLMSIVLTIIFLYVLTKLLVYYFLPKSGLFVLIKLTRFDCMAIGAIFAINLENEKFKKIVFHKATQTCALIILLLPFLFKIIFFANIEIEVISLASAVWIINTGFNEKSFIKVESTVIQYLGKISYGIYVYHLIIIYLVSKISLIDHVVVSYVVIITAVIIFARLSYWLIESPILKLKDRYSLLVTRF